MDNDSSPQLQPPGAGLPFIQKLALRYYFGPYVSKRTPWEETCRRFDKVHKKILKEIEGLSEKELNTRVLIRPLTGIEDSSRFWSIALALEHILLVGEQIEHGIVELSHGRKLDKTVDIGKLKPPGHLSTSEILHKFKSYTEQTMKDLEPKVKDKNSKTTHDHPWFGPLTCQQWHWLLAVHGALHLKQIQEIKKGLSGSTDQRSSN